MGEMLRSDLMTYCNVYLQPECAFDILAQFGEMGCAQFVDTTPDMVLFQRNYISEVCRCAEMERKLRFLRSEMEKDNTFIVPLMENPMALHPNEMSPLDNIIDQLETDIKESSTNQVIMNKRYLEVTELHYVLTSLEPMLEHSDFGVDQNTSKAGKGDFNLGGQLLVLTGVVNRTKCMVFQLMMWRISKGNVYFRQSKEDKEFLDPVTSQPVRKVAFLAVCQGEELKSRIDKVCSGFRVNVYPCPETYDARMKLINMLEMQLIDFDTILKESKYHRCKALYDIGKNYMKWATQVKKTKAIYHTLNLFNLDITKNCLLGQCWVPDNELSKMQAVCFTVSEAKQAAVASFMTATTTLSTPPTFHRTNKFTAAFQALINAYGVSQYQELNPGLYTIITFPFLFSLMFADCGHGMLMLLAAIWMIRNERKFSRAASANEICNIFFSGRYVILLMSMFSIYAGLLYNDFFGLGLTLKTPYWKNHDNADDIAVKPYFEIDAKLEFGNVYVFGLDPVWKVSTNKIMFENSLKMKLSIIIGVIHMMFGLSLSFFNHLHFKRYYAIVLEFIPQMVFLAFLFFWLVIMLFMKWFMYSADSKVDETKSGCAPLILILFIDMMLFKTSTIEGRDCKPYMFSYQEILQRILVVISLLCIPIMLFGSPVYLHRMNKKNHLIYKEQIRIVQSRRQSEEENLKEQYLLEEIKKCEEQKFGELMIHQAVHTIEFVLSTISHTASYLRLWALSLAHAQLSEMLWSMIFERMALKDHTYLGSIKIFFIFAVWAMFTLSILVMMEGLSAFLHTLRLHWVEFMSKFYNGGGSPFNPFSFNALLSSELIEEKSDGLCKKLHRARNIV